MRELAFRAPPLADAVVKLRLWRQADVRAGLMAFAGPTVQRFSWPRATPFTEDDAHTFLIEQALARGRGESLEFALVEPGPPDGVLGGASLDDVEREQRRARVGYRLAPEGRGRGIATHAIRLLAGWAFGELQVARLEVTCGPDNEASQRIAQRCGFARGPAPLAPRLQGRAPRHRGLRSAARRAAIGARTAASEGSGTGRYGSPAWVCAETLGMHGQLHTPLGSEGSLPSLAAVAVRTAQYAAS